MAKAVETSKAKDDKRGSQVRMVLPRIAHSACRVFVVLFCNLSSSIECSRMHQLE